MTAPDVTRRQARRDAMVVLYQHDITGASIDDLYDNLKQESGHMADGFTREEVGGVLGALAEVDAVIDAASRNWPAHRLAALERSILRLGVYEISRRDDIPAEVSIDEAVSLAKRFCSREAAALVNGVLGNVAAGRDGGDGADAAPKAKD
ncbi:MAG: transcription antitermination factor NusB [Thermoleophilia bacterium]